MPVIELNGKNIENVHSYNYLGVIVDDKLLFDEFIDAKCNKTNLKIYQMDRMCIDSSIALTIYKQMILPQFDYADFMIISACKSKFDKLENVQEKAIRYLHNSMSSRPDMKELFALYHVQNLSMRINEHLGSVMYRQSKFCDKLDIVRLPMNLRSHNKGVATNYGEVGGGGYRTGGGGGKWSFTSSKRGGQKKL